MVTYTEEQVSAAMELYPALWVKKYKIKNEVGMPIEFEKRKFLWDIYNDLSPHQVLLKPPQIGATVMNTIKSLYVAKKMNRQIIYTLPTQGDVQDMVGGSINRIIAQNPVLMGWVKDHDTVEQKTVGSSMIFYRGTFTQKQAMMIPSGLNIHDEVDASDPAIITQYETRLQAQEDGGWRWYFSHPSLAGHGVDIYWQQSDQKEWFIKCNKCKHEQTLTWPESINTEKSIYICKECKGEISDNERINGRWSPTSSGEFSGYHVSQLMLWNKSAKDIIKAYNDPLKDKQYFYNYVLGLPYVSSDDRIEPNTVLLNCVDQVNDQEGRSIIGADTGHGIHYVILNKQGVFYYDHATEITATKTPYDVIRGHLKRFPKSIAVFDQGGDLIGVRQLQQEFPGRIFLCFYNKDRKSLDLVEWGTDSEYGKVRVDRNRMMTLVIEQIRDIGRIRLCGTKEEWAEFASHFGNIYREKLMVKEQRGKDNKELYGAEYVWKRNGPDHFCFHGDTLIETEEGKKKIKDIKVGDKVLTRLGFKSVYKSWLTQISAKTVTAIFSNGSKIIATPNHKFVTLEGYSTLDSLLYSDILITCTNQKLLYTKGLITDVTQNLKDGQIDSTSVQVEPSEPGDLKDFINKYGLITLEKYLRVLLYITKIVTRSIMKFQTWLVCREENISPTISQIDSRIFILDEPMKNISKKSEDYLMDGGVQKMEKNGIQYMLIKVFSWINQRLITVLSVVLKQLHKLNVVVNFVPNDVHLVGMHENGEKSNVYNISVEDEHEYFANNVLVSNCHALLYAIVGLQRYGGEMATIVGDSPLAGLQRGQIVQEQKVGFSIGDFGKDNQLDI